MKFSYQKGNTAIYISIAIALILILIVPGVALGTAFAYINQHTGAMSPSGSSGINGECYMPDQYWTNGSTTELPNAQAVLDKLGDRDVKPSKADVEKILKDVRDAGVNPAITLATWGKEQGYGNRDNAFGTPGTSFDSELRIHIETLVYARDGLDVYKNRPQNTPIQIWWRGKYTPSSLAGNENDVKNFFTFLRQLVPNQIDCSAQDTGLVPLFKQGGNTSWANQSYGFGTTLATSACGPTSVAMVLKYYNKDVDPSITADFCLKNNFRIKNQGTSAQCFSALAKKYDLEFETVSWDTAQQLLKAKKPLIVSVKASRFTSGGHYLVLTGLNGNTVSINDSGPRNITSGTTTEILNAYNHGYYYIHP